MDLETLSIAPFHRFEESELRASGLLPGLVGALSDDTSARRVFETPFCQGLVAQIETKLEQPILPLTNALYCMLRRDPAFTESFWHLDSDEWAFDNTYNIWLPLLFLDPASDGIQILDSAGIRALIAQGYGQLDELDDHLFRDEIVELERLPHTRFYVQYDADFAYRLWSMDEVAPRYVQPREGEALLLNARIFHRTNPDLRARVLWGFKFALESAEFSPLMRIPNERVAVWKFYRRHLYISPARFQRQVMEKLERRAAEQLRRARIQHGDIEHTERMRHELLPVLVGWLEGSTDGDSLRAGLEAAISRLAALPSHATDMAHGFRPLT